MSQRSQGPLVEAQRREIVAILAAGGSRRAAAAFAGCPSGAIGRIANREPEFRRQVRRAERHSEIVHLKNIHAAAAKAQYWRAAAWMLERLFPERYGKRKPKTLTYDEVEELFVQLADLLSVEIGDRRLRRTMLRRVRQMVAGFARRPRARRHER